MNEKALSVLEQYDLKIKSTYRSKGNYGCETENGRYILQEYNNSNEKMATMSAFYSYLEGNGFTVDSGLWRKTAVTAMWNNSVWQWKILPGFTKQLKI